jgi:hypothetical protein
MGHPRHPSAATNVPDPCPIRVVTGLGCRVRSDPGHDFRYCTGPSGVPENLAAETRVIARRVGRGRI